MQAESSSAGAWVSRLRSFDRGPLGCANSSRYSLSSSRVRSPSVAMVRSLSAMCIVMR